MFIATSPSDSSLGHPRFAERSQKWFPILNFLPPSSGSPFRNRHRPERTVDFRLFGGDGSRGRLSTRLLGISDDGFPNLVEHGRRNPGSRRELGSEIYLRFPVWMHIDMGSQSDKRVLGTVRQDCRRQRDQGRSRSTFLVAGRGISGKVRREIPYRHQHLLVAFQQICRTVHLRHGTSLGPSRSR